MNAVNSLHAFLLSGLCAACSGPPPEHATPDVPAQAETAVAAIPAPTPQATPTPVPVTEPVAESVVEPVAETPAAATVPAPPPPVAEKPRPTTISKAPGALPLPASNRAGKEPAPVHATVTALSRGKGVPSETREALKQIRALLEARQASADVTEVQVQRIGIEGESRLCIEFPSAADAQSVLPEMRRIAAGRELLEIAETPCPPRKEPNP